LVLFMRRGGKKGKKKKGIAGVPRPYATHSERGRKGGIGKLALSKGYSPRMRKRKRGAIRAISLRPEGKGAWGFQERHSVCGGKKKRRPTSSSCGWNRGKKKGEGGKISCLSPPPKRRGENGESNKSRPV